MFLNKLQQFKKSTKLPSKKKILSVKFSSLTMPVVTAQPNK